MIRKETGQWTYQGGYRQANGNAANKLELVRGLDEDSVSCVVQGLAGGASGGGHAVGIGIDSTTVNSAQLYGSNLNTAVITQLQAYYEGNPGIGYHALNWLEHSASAGTTNWYGDAGNPTTYQMGMVASVMS